MTGTLWLLLVACGVGLMWVMRYTRHPMIDAVLVRASAFSFAGAGIVGAGGWIGDLLGGLVGGLNTVGAQLGSAAIGSAAVWIVWAGLSLMWVLTILPERWFGRSIPDWLAISGVVLPGMAASIPGEFGQAMTRAITGCGQLMINLVGSAFGVGGGS
jgi:hypothetical protein